MGRAGAATHPHLHCHRGPSACMYTIKTFVFNQLDFFIQLIALVRWGCGWEREPLPLVPQLWDGRPAARWYRGWPRSLSGLSLHPKM